MSPLTPRGTVPPMRSKHITVTVSLERVRQSAEELKARTGVALIAVIKADAYGLGAEAVADVLAPVVDEFAFFALDEARALRRGGLILGPADADPAEYKALRARPTIASIADAERYRGLAVAISVDTGMQRFGAAPELFDDIRRISGAEEAFTHGSDPAIAARLRDICGGRVPLLHAACTGMLAHREAWLDAVRPGLALYRGAVRVSTRITHARDTYGPAGYTGFRAPRVGLFPAGYAEGVQPGPVLVNGRPQHIVEVNMNASYVTIAPDDRVGDEIVLLGDGLTEAEIARQTGVREHEALCRYTAMGIRHYAGSGAKRPRRVTRTRTAPVEVIAAAADPVVSPEAARPLSVPQPVTTPDAD
jgi:alanine racemase